MSEDSVKSGDDRVVVLGSGSCAPARPEGSPMFSVEVESLSCTIATGTMVYCEELSIEVHVPESVTWSRSVCLRRKEPGPSTAPICKPSAPRTVQKMVCTPVDTAEDLESISSASPERSIPKAEPRVPPRLASFSEDSSNGFNPFRPGDTDPGEAN